MALRSVEIRNRVDELFDFRMLDRRGQNVRKGFAIVVPNGAGGWKVWGAGIFPSMESANSTAARCVGGVCDIVAAREVAYRRERAWKGWDRQILLDEEPNAQ
jgi:hypothetical protein